MIRLESCFSGFFMMAAPYPRSFVSSATYSKPRAVSPESCALFRRTTHAAPDQLNQTPAPRLYSIRGAANQVQLRRLLGADVRAAGRDHKQLEQVFAAAGDARGEYLLK